MSPQFMGILLGGLIPAVFFGISGVLQKSSNQEGISTGFYLMCIGASVFMVGVALQIFQPQRLYSLRSISYALLLGFFWGTATGLIGIALSRYGISISKLVPLYNMNTIVAVCLGLIIYKEWAQVDMIKLSIGAVLVVIGGTLTALS